MQFLISVLHTQQLLVFAVSWLHPPFTCLFFPLTARESSFLSLSTQRGGCRTWNGENSVCAVRMQLGNSPTALRTFFSCCVVVCAPAHIRHSGNSSPWKGSPPPPRLVSSGRWRLSFFSAPSFAQSATAVSLFAQRRRAHGRREHVPFILMQMCSSVTIFPYFTLNSFLVFAGETNVLNASVRAFVLQD